MRWRMLALLVSPVFIVSGTPALVVDNAGYGKYAARKHAVEVDTRCADSITHIADSLDNHLAQGWLVLDSLQNRSRAQK